MPSSDATFEGYFGNCHACKALGRLKAEDVPEGVEFEPGFYACPNCGEKKFWVAEEYSVPWEILPKKGKG